MRKYLVPFAGAMAMMALTACGTTRLNTQAAAVDVPAPATASTSTTVGVTTTVRTAPPTTVRVTPPATVRVTTTTVRVAVPATRSTPVTTTAPAAATAGSGCHPSYGGCVPVASDVDCAGGSGNGPAYTSAKNIPVTGPDVYGLDADSDGLGCES